MRSLLQLLLHTVNCVALALAVAACGGSGSSGDGAGDAVGTASARTALTYHDHTKALIDSRCVTCHQAGGQAPFALETYSQVVSRQSAMVFVLENQTMPLPGFSTLTPQERELLILWLNAGADRGEPGAPGATTPYTYYGHTKAIIDEKCANCHRPGDIAPFALTDYEGVFAVRAAIAHQVDSGAMPPWPPTNHYLPLKNNRSLTDAERAKLLSWIDGGAPEGDPAAFVPVVKELPQIDYQMRISLNEAYTPVEHPDEYRCMLIDWPLQETVYVDAVTVVPDARAEVHHVFAVIADPDVVHIFEEADGADGRPGFPCWGAPSPPGALVPPRTLSVWAPGITGGYLPEGTGVRVDPGSKVVMQMHYNTINTDPVPDQSSLDIHYVDSVEREAITVFFLDVGWYPSGGMPIPAGDPNVTAQYTDDASWALRFAGAAKAGINIEEPFALHSVFMHQHVLGKSTSIELIRADGTEVMLVDIRDWDFDWQDEYFFEEEVIIYPGDELRLTCTWDNSAENQQFIDGEQIEPRYTEFGEGTLDEMCVNYFYVTRVRDGDVGEVQHHPPTVAFHQPDHMQEFRPGDYVPVELLVNAFRLQEPQSGHAAHGHDAMAGSPGGPGHDHHHHSGHYHLYLNTEDDDADHLTRWDTSTFYKLPDDLPPGQHTLRVSLRDDDHNAIGVENRLTFVVEEPREDLPTRSLIDVNAWQPTTAATDSMAAERPAEVNCPSNAWYEEDGALEVQTGYCDYLSLSQPTLAAVGRGDLVHLVLWHAQLRFEEPAEAHVAISLGGEVIWEDEIEIPNAGGIYDIEIPSTVDAPAGSDLEFHLHNHGFNSWTLLTVEVRDR